MLMIKYYYRKPTRKPIRKWFRMLSFGIIFLGLTILLYVFSPLVMWQIYIVPIFASQNITTSIPRNEIVNQGSNDSITNKDYTDAKNWFPYFNPSQALEKPKVSSYTLSIPKIRIKDAYVSTIDLDLAKHLVNYQGTSIPGEFGNAVIFGHSTLPQLYNPKDYKTIFANIHKLQIGDSIYSNVNGVTYLHKIFNITVVNPNNASAFEQNYDNSYLTLVTCTPPGTVWKRLVIKARLSVI